MQSITDNVFFEDQYPGVTLGVISLPHGLLQIDAPPSPEDSRTWRAALMNLGGGPDRVLINLDAHPDRTLGVRAMDCTVIAHERAAQVFRSRPNTFKAGVEETGADWESISGLGNIRWAPPEISFTHTMTIRWGDRGLLLEHHPGPSSGSSWVILPEEKVVFVGDSVVKNQPPFLAGADIPAWIETLNLLLSSQYKGYQIICGRGGLVLIENVKAQKDYLKLVQEKLTKLSGKKASPDATEGLVAPLLAAFKVPSNRQHQYTQRLRHGLSNYYTRHFHTTITNTGEE